MTTDEKLREVAKNEFPEWTYIFDDWYVADRDVSKHGLPAIIALLPFSGQIRMRNGQTRLSQNCSIAFVDRVRKEAKGEEKSEVYNRMLTAAIDFIVALNRSGYFTALEVTNFTVLYDQLSTIVTGVYIDITLEELQGRCD
mgnify:CR=1 FL=1